MKLFRPVIALLLVSLLLLLLDWNNRTTHVRGELPTIAIFKIASRLVLDQSEEGTLDALKERGFEDDKTCIIKRYSAEGDAGTANSIAQNIVSSGFDMVISISTPALQIMANANREGKMIHVFSTVTDPYVSGVGITGTAPDQHPPHLVGIGSFQPVEETFELAKKMNPGLKKVGTVWCTSEVCSEACVRLARKKCAELGIELIEASVESTIQVLEAATSLTSRGVQALWVGGDNVVEAGIGQLITAANQAKIALFTNNPYNVYGNVLFALGAEYYEVGEIAGNLAADILNGKSTEEIGVSNVLPKYLKTNPEALKNITEKWELTEYTDHPDVR